MKISKSQDGKHLFVALDFFDGEGNRALLGLTSSDHRHVQGLYVRIDREYKGKSTPDIGGLQVDCSDMLDAQFRELCLTLGLEVVKV